MQSNFAASKSSGQEALFRIIRSANYWEVDIKLVTPKMIIFRISIKHTFWTHKRNVSWRRFFYAPKKYIIKDSFFLKKKIKNRSHSLNPICGPNLFRISEYFEKKTKFEFSRFYCRFGTKYENSNQRKTSYLLIINISLQTLI